MCCEPKVAEKSAFGCNHLSLINQSLGKMSHKHKMSKHEQEERDAAEGRRFMAILAIAVAALVLLLYLVVR
ncbi:MAG TPA: hypothetical protein PK971_08725 [Saprospiraceae bacterium]|nr:hypothetical protein [Saprospiraceae bacterium]HND88399.1 hypothetical protein [Saprospiraceae bacterium]